MALVTDVQLTPGKQKLFKRHFEKAMKGEDVLDALQHLRRSLPGPLIVIWDHLSAHHDGQVQQWIESEPDLYQEWLPPYAPNLNPEELCNGNIKVHLRGATPETTEQLRRQVDREFARLRRRPDLLITFFKHVGLLDVTRIT